MDYAVVLLHVLPRRSDVADRGACAGNRLTHVLPAALQRHLSLNLVVGADSGVKGNLSSGIDLNSIGAG